MLLARMRSHSLPSIACSFARAGRRCGAGLTPYEPARPGPLAALRAWVRNGAICVRNLPAFLAFRSISYSAVPRRKRTVSPRGRRNVIVQRDGRPGCHSGLRNCDGLLAQYNPVALPIPCRLRLTYHRQAPSRWHRTHDRHAADQNAAGYLMLGGGARLARLAVVASQPFPPWHL